MNDVISLGGRGDAGGVGDGGVGGVGDSGVGDLGGELDPGVVYTASAVPVPLTPVAAAQVVAGAPATGSIDLDEDMGLGIWEMTPGAMRDVEIDEVFVVVAGSATVEFVKPTQPSIELRPGAIVRLEAGMQTVWTVRETLRKVYLA